MVSSTFYDLRQIRSDIYDFVTGDLGYECLMSEMPSFPVDPDLDTVANCRIRVEDNADMLVLIVGGRYGAVDPSWQCPLRTSNTYLHALSGFPFSCLSRATSWMPFPSTMPTPQGISAT
jgi:hypothetical protein